ncbi:MAG: YceI family protein [Usitatibacter sp.]
MRRAMKWMFPVIVAGASASALAAAESYTVDPDHTYPSLEFSHMGLSIWRGKFDRTSGKVMLDRAAKTGSTEIRVDTSSIDFGHAKMKEFAITPDWLDVEKFPAMTYTGVLRFRADAPESVDGQLTLLGVTKPLKLTINSFRCIPHPILKREVCGADAEGDLNRADFGMSLYSEGEAGKIHLRIQVEAIKDP